MVYDVMLVPSQKVLNYKVLTFRNRYMFLLIKFHAPAGIAGNWVTFLVGSAENFALSHLSPSPSLLPLSRLSFSLPFLPSFLLHPPFPFSLLSPLPFLSPLPSFPSSLLVRGPTHRPSKPDTNLYQTSQVRVGGRGWSQKELCGYYKLRKLLPPFSRKTQKYCQRIKLNGCSIKVCSK